MKDNWIVELTEKEDDIWFADIECNSRQEAIREGMEKAKSQGLKSYRIGRSISCEVPNIFADWIIENAQEQLGYEVGEVADDYLEGVNEEQIKELEEEINEVFQDWNKRYNLEPNCYKVVDVERINVE